MRRTCRPLSSRPPQDSRLPPATLLRQTMRGGVPPRAARRRGESGLKPRSQARVAATPPQQAPACVVVSIVSHGHRDAVLALLCDLAHHARGSVTRVVLTLNIAEPGLEAAARQACAGLTLNIRRNPRPLGFGENHNAAFAAAVKRGDGGAHFAVLNPDVRLCGDPFPALCAALARDAHAGCAYPAQLDARGQPCNPPRPVPTPANLLRRYIGGSELAQGAHWVNAAFALFRASAFTAVGGFDVGYRLYCEDVDLCLRLQVAGWSLARAACTVQHVGIRASRGSIRHLYWHAQSLIRLWFSETLRDFRSLPVL